MNAETLRKLRWFWPWQDEKEEAWLEAMSLDGWHLAAVGLPCLYTFHKGRPVHYIYRLDYINVTGDRLAEYLQLFRDAGWEYLGELSNWRYWRTAVTGSQPAEIFTDRESKIQKYRRLLGYMAFFLMFLVFMGANLLQNAPHTGSSAASVIYRVGLVLYAVIIPLYVVVVVQLVRRIRRLRHSG